MVAGAGLVIEVESYEGGSGEAGGGAGQAKFSKPY